MCTKKGCAQSVGAEEYTDCFPAEGLNSSQRVSWYDAKQADGEGPEMLELWGMQRTPLLRLLPVPLCPEVVELKMDLSIG